MRIILEFLGVPKSQIEEFHKHQLGNSWNIFKENGVIMGQIARPLERVALYVYMEERLHIPQQSL